MRLQTFRTVWRNKMSNVAKVERLGVQLADVLNLSKDLDLAVQHIIRIVRSQRFFDAWPDLSDAEQQTVILAMKRLNAPKILDILLSRLPELTIKSRDELRHIARRFGLMDPVPLRKADLIEYIQEKQEQQKGSNHAG